MSKKQPNIIECDGLVVRGPSGKMRAEIPRAPTFPSSRDPAESPADD